MDWRYLFFSFEGRITRKPYWIGSCILIVIGLISYFIQSRIGDPRPLLLVDVALLYPNFAVMLKRAQDRDMSPVLPAAAVLLAAIFYALEFFGLIDDSSASIYDLLLIPFALITIYLIIVLGFFKGTPGPNRFGPNPLEAPR
jgi:uncharacterized membrane protein YhaH (DUF805 family)